MALKRQSILTNLATVLKGISAGQTYYSNVDVHLWRTTAVQDDELTNKQGRPVAVLIIRDKGRDPDVDMVSEAGNLQQHSLRVEIEVCVSTEEQARKAIADILKAIGGDPKLSNTAIDVIDGGDDMYSDQAGVRVFAPVLKLQIPYQTKRFLED
jgi:hypothetical protein